MERLTTLNAPAFINAAVLKSGGILFVMDGILYMYPPITLSPNLQRLVNRYDRQLKFFLQSMSL